MKNLVAVFIFGLYFAQSPMPSKESDRKHEGFVGAVKTVTTYLSAISGNWQSTPRGKQCKFKVVIYDSTGRLIQSSVFSDCGRSGEFRDTFTYDKDGNRYDKNEMIEVRGGIPAGPPPAIGKTISSSEIVNGPSETFKYNNEGKKIESTGFFGEGKLMHKFVYKYDERGRVYEVLRFFPDEKAPSKTIFSYVGDQQFPASSRSYRADGGLSEKYVFSDYQMNSIGDWINRKAVITDSTGKRIGTETRQIEYYPQAK
jgi:hypothetical protein